MSALRPYLFRAIYDWALDNGFTPHVVINASAAGVIVPAGFVRDGRITLNIHPQAIQQFVYDNEGVAFSARFNGAPFEVFIPMIAVVAVFAKENGRGMFFPEEPLETPTPPGTGESKPLLAPSSPVSNTKPKRTILKRVK